MKKSPLFVPGFLGIFYAICGLWLSGCDYKTECGKARISIHYVGYELPDLDTIIIYRYKKPYTAGARKIDSAVWIQPDHIRYTLTGDTAIGNLIQEAGQPFALHLETTWDYKIFIPASVRTYLVTDMREKQTSMDVPLRCTGPKYVCTNPVEQIRVNGIIRRPNEWFNSQVLYLNK